MYNNYKHFVSLGANCYIAENLKQLGLRECSYPFDWLFTADFSGVIDTIRNRFQDFLSYDVLLQHKNNKSRYYNSVYKFSFFHDFNKYESLKSQLSYVQDKYNRRINRFYKDINQPTLFFRYIISKNDVSFIKNNYQKINNLIKSFCSLNHIIYITHYEELLELPIDIYVVDKDNDDWITRNPLLKNSTLCDHLKETIYENKEANISFSCKRKNRKSLIRILCRIFKIEYVHSKIYSNQ